MEFNREVLTEKETTVLEEVMKPGYELPPVETWSFAHVKALSIIKWSYIAGSWNYKKLRHENYMTMVKAFPILDRLKAYCGFCTYFNIGCDGCPLDDSALSVCTMDSDGAYNKWVSFADPIYCCNNGQKYADEMLDIICRVEADGALRA